MTTMNRAHQPFLRIAMGLVLLSELVRTSRAEPPIVDAPFAQWYRDRVIRDESPLANDVRGLAFDAQGRVWAATAAGPRRLEGDKWVTPAGDKMDGPTYDVESDSHGVVWFASWQGPLRAMDGRVERAGELTAPLAAVATSDVGVVVGGPDGIWEWQANGRSWQRLGIPTATSIQDLAIARANLWIGAHIGLFRSPLGTGETRRFHRADELQSADVRSIVIGSDGQLWIGSSGGIDVYDDHHRVASFTGAVGLPSTDVKALSFDAGGTLWVGTSLGLARYHDGKWSLWHSPRWLPHDDVRDVNFDSDGAAWVATAGGVSRIAQRPMTLADKAEHYMAMVRSRHVRPPGLVEKCFLRTPGDVSTFEPMDTDNDGLFTGLYLAAECFRYAVTRDAAAKRNADEAYAGMEFLQTVTDTPGFVARTVIPAEWTHMADANRTYSPVESADERVGDPRFKRVEERWRKSRDGQWLWKGDTSSDEISGHYFAYGVYYDLAADETQRERVRRHVGRITDYIIDGALVLRDIDGQHTRWGVWSPEKLNGDPNWSPERGVNSVEILSFLRVAQHVTGELRYDDVARELLEKHGYEQNILDPRPTGPSQYTFIDDQLLALAYRGLLAYETDRARRALYIKSLDRWYETVRAVHSPLYGFVYGAARRENFDARPCVELLRDMPLDMVRWTVDNSRREDVRLVRRPSIELWQTDRLLPPSERGLAGWDGNPYAAREGADGRDESSSVHWLLPYWMGRYERFIGAPQR